MLTLSKALKTSRIADFVKQEEAGIGPASRRKLDAAIKRLATTPLKSEDRTSRLSSDDDSTER